MRKIGLTVLLYILRGFVYIKRFFVAIWATILRLYEGLSRWLRQTIGFFLYKRFLSLSKFFGKAKIPFSARIVTFFSQRLTLQISLLVVCVAVMIPHSKLYSRDLTSIPGQDSLLFALVGPTDEIDAIDEVSLNFDALVVSSDVQGWRDGAVSTVAPNPIGEDVKTIQELSGLSTGGSLLKPTIIGGAEIKTDAGTQVQATGRNEVTTYLVEEGDVIGTIAQKFGISVETLLWANNLTIRSYIRPGDTLTILPTTGVMHEVKSGDTISKIARLYDASQDDIIEFNNLASAGSISIGQELVIPEGRRPQATFVPPVTTPSNPSTPVVTTPVVSTPPPSIPASGVGYIWPTAAKIVTQYFGVRHTAIDIAGPIGTPIYAARAGSVIKSQCGYNGGYGCYIIIDHGDGVQTLYAHHSQLFVSVGQQVSQGQTIAAMGSTGRSTGPHTHFEVRVNGVKQNPLSYVKQ